MSRPLLILGETGQLARALAAAAEARGLKTILAGRARADLEVRGAAGRLIAELRPQAVINAAAYTLVDQAESEPERARAINAEGAAEAAEAAARAGARFVHVSTDYVFNSGGPHDETSRPDPMNVYGRTKLEGELAVLDTAPEAAVLRASGVFSGAGRDFPSAVWRLAHRPDPIRVVADQQVSPVFAGDLAQRLLALAEIREANGLFHCGGLPGVSWRDFAQAALARLAQAGGPSRCAEPIDTMQFPRPAPRPSDSRLAGVRLSEATGLPAPEWAPPLKTALEHWRRIEA